MIQKLILFLFFLQNTESIKRPVFILHVTEMQFMYVSGEGNEYMHEIESFTITKSRNAANTKIHKLRVLILNVTRHIIKIVKLHKMYHKFYLLIASSSTIGMKAKLIISLNKYIEMIQINYWMMRDVGKTKQSIIHRSSEKWKVD